jgi:hypothetical protein
VWWNFNVALCDMDWRKVSIDHSAVRS